MAKFKVGDQIAYVPTHARGDLKHPDVELGFVTSVSPDGEYAFCRYFAKSNEYLRTTANSEATYIRDLVHKQHRPQVEIDAMLRAFGYFVITKGDNYAK